MPIWSCREGTQSGLVAKGRRISIGDFADIWLDNKTRQREPARLDHPIRSCRCFRNELRREILAVAAWAASCGVLLRFVCAGPCIDLPGSTAGDWTAWVDRCSTGCTLIGPVTGDFRRAMRDNARAPKLFARRPWEQSLCKNPLAWTGGLKTWIGRLDNIPLLNIFQMGSYPWNKGSIERPSKDDADVRRTNFSDANASQQYSSLPTTIADKTNGDWTSVYWKTHGRGTIEAGEPDLFHIPDCL